MKNTNATPIPQIPPPIVPADDHKEGEEKWESVFVPWSSAGICRDRWHVLDSSKRILAVLFDQETAITLVDSRNASLASLRARLKGEWEAIPSVLDAIGIAARELQKFAPMSFAIDVLDQARISLESITRVSSGEGEAPSGQSELVETLRRQCGYLVARAFYVCAYNYSVADSLVPTGAMIEDLKTECYRTRDFLLKFDKSLAPSSVSPNVAGASEEEKESRSGYRGSRRKPSWHTPDGGLPWRRRDYRTLPTVSRQADVAHTDTGGAFWRDLQPDEQPGRGDRIYDPENCFWILHCDNEGKPANWPGWVSNTWQRRVQGSEVHAPQAATPLHKQESGAHGQHVANGMPPLYGPSVPSNKDEERTMKCMTCGVTKHVNDFATADDCEACVSNKDAEGKGE